MEYSAVTHPTPLPRKNEGTDSSTEAVQITFVSPNSTNTEPSACFVKFLVMVTFRNEWGLLRSIRAMYELPRIRKHLKLIERVQYPFRHCHVKQKGKPDPGFPFLCSQLLLIFQPRCVLLLRALFIRMVVSRSSPQQVHFQASKERTKS